jgi:diaminopropionate ammonia-lyase
LDFRWIVNKRKDSFSPIPDFMTRVGVKPVRDFHAKFSEYGPTPLVSLSGLAGELGLGNLSVKDESKRMGLNSFKMLGSSYAVGRLIAQKLGKHFEKMEFGEFCAENTRDELGKLVFATATDGNHGRGLAWTANRLGYSSVVFLPKGSSEERVRSIAKNGAQTFVTDCNYDDTVRLMIRKATENGWQIVQDTSWEGYDEVPRWVMQGYTTIASEYLEQAGEKGIPAPTHIFLQAGVGSFAAAIAAFFRDACAAAPPRIVVVEPNRADCFYQSAKQGKIAMVGGDLDSIMAGLSCGEPSPIAWSILKDSAAFLSVPDWVTARGMRIYSAPCGSDRRIVSGESGAVTLGALSLMMQRGEYAPLRDALGLGPHSSVLLVSTEGDTCREMYRKIVWEGEYRSAAE